MSEDVQLANISHSIEVGFQAIVVILAQIREGRKGPPSEADIEDAARLLRSVSNKLGHTGW
jgi:predicted patatin/cPLA2 family phospholipase